MSANMYDAWDCGDRPAIRAKLAKQEAIYRFAKQSGFIWPECFDEELEKFVALVEAAEREACAKAIDDLSLAHPGRADLTALQCAAAIRERGQE